MEIVLDNSCEELDAESTGVAAGEEAPAAVEDVTWREVVLSQQVRC